MDNHHPVMQDHEVNRRVNHTAQLIREAARRELESEMRGLLMAARMHNFSFEFAADGTVSVVDLRSV